MRNKIELEELVQQVKSFAHERDQYDARRREAMAKLEEYRAECLAWREWKKNIEAKFDGLFAFEYPVKIEVDWSELSKDFPWPE
jgi:hypothetical protein